jgi:hypothetical protein
MTDEELDKARANEAWRIHIEAGGDLGNMAIIAARLAREGWKPARPIGVGDRVARVAGPDGKVVAINTEFHMAWVSWPHDVHSLCPLSDLTRVTP